MFVGGDGPSSGAGLSAKLRRARATGQLNLSNTSLGVVPPEVLRLTAASALDADEKFWEVLELTNLDLSHNRIDHVPEELNGDALPQLRTLRLGHNELPFLHPNVGTLTELGSLRLEHNALRRLPEELGTLLQLQELDVSHNDLSELPEAVCVPGLRHLRAKGNRLRSLPQALDRCAFLATLDASENGLATAPEALGRLAHLSELDLHGNALGSGGARFPSLQGLRELKVCNLRGNRLSCLPELPDLAAPRQVQLLFGENRMEGDLNTDAFHACATAVTLLDLSNNQIAGLRGEDLGHLTALKSLDLRNNDLSDVPHELGYLGRLNRVLLDGNPLRGLRRGVLGGGNDAFKRFLRTRGPPPEGVDSDALLTEEANPFAARSEFAGPNGDGLSSVDQAVHRIRDAGSRGTLDLSNNGIAAFPFSPADLSEMDAILKEAAGIFDCDSGREMSGVTVLRAVALDGNALTELPTGLGVFQDLQLFTASRNSLCRLADDFGSLQLKRADLSHNKLTAAALDAALLPGPTESGPQGPPLCKSLTVLSLMANDITEVPTAVFALEVLEELDLAYNRITELPGITPEAGGWHHLQRLTALNVGNNAVASLGSLACHPPPGLLDLNVENNNLRTIPPELGLLGTLRTLTIAGNPQKSIRSQVIQQGTPAILKLLRTRLPDDYAPAPTPVFAKKSAMPASATAGIALCETENVRPQAGVPPRQAPGPNALRHLAWDEGPGSRATHLVQGAAPSASPELRAGVPENRCFTHSGVEQAVEPPPGPQPQGAFGPELCAAEADLVTLTAEVRVLEDQLENPSLSQAKRYAMKKTLQNTRAKRIRVERSLGLRR